MRTSAQFDRYPCFPTRALPSTEAIKEKVQGMDAGASPSVSSVLRRWGRGLLPRFPTRSRTRREAGA